MSGEVLIRAEEVSVKFTRSLKSAMRYGVTDIARDLLSRPARGDRMRPDEFWAVDRVSLEVRRGECLGLIGPNGAGKSTLLKMLNGIIIPDCGRVELGGRVGALLELGAGFHPLLTGRENIYVNGSILGLSRREIEAKFDAIVAFSELEEFLDTPVKFYSSGMFVRLGFAVAAQLKPDILLIDEVLAVGDIAFRAKCYTQIVELLKDSAVIFVSHNLPIVGRTCHRGLVLDRGRTVCEAPSNEAIQSYLALFPGQASHVHECGVRLVSHRIEAGQEAGRYVLNAGDPLVMEVELEAEREFASSTILLGFISLSGEMVAEWNSWTQKDPFHLQGGRQKFRLALDPLLLNPGIYQMSLIVTSENRIEHLLLVHCGWTFRVEGERLGNAPYQMPGKIGPA